MIKISEKMKRYIHIQKADRAFIIKAFKVTGKTVYNALSYDAKKGNTDLAKRIRQMALARGGIIMREVPELETLFDADGYIRQYLPGGVLLEIHKAENWCDVYKKGEKQKRFEHVMWSDMQRIQDWAAQL